MKTFNLDNLYLQIAKEYGWVPVDLPQLLSRETKQGKPAYITWDYGTDEYGDQYLLQVYTKDPDDLSAWSFWYVEGIDLPWLDSDKAWFYSGVPGKFYALVPVIPSMLLEAEEMIDEFREYNLLIEVDEENVFFLIPMEVYVDDQPFVPSFKEVKR